MDLLIPVYRIPTENWKNNGLMKGNKGNDVHVRGANIQ
jgi:hypothetical protein